MIVVGIDPGTTTGFAVWDTELQLFLDLTSMPLHRALKRLEQAPPDLVIFEDARKRRGFYSRADEAQSRSGAGIREGVGSVKRDCAIWEEVLIYLKIPFVARLPHTTKRTAAEFQRLTGWQASTNEHSRDAGLIVAHMNTPMARVMLATRQSLQLPRSRGRRRARA